MSRQTPVSLFHIGLGIPCSTVLQILLCFGCMAVMKKKWRQEGKMREDAGKVTK